jgi:hypothetical protein
MADGTAQSPISVTVPTGLPPQACAPSRPFRPAYPSMPAAFSGRVPRAEPGSARLSRGQRLLLAGAAVAGVWLLGSLGHPAAAHAEAAGRPAAPPASTVSSQLSRLPAGPSLAGSRTRPGATVRALGRSATSARIGTPIAHRISPTVARVLPAAGLPNGLPTPPLPGGLRVPPVSNLPLPPIGAPVVNLPLPPVSSLPVAGLPNPVAAAEASRPGAALPSAGIEQGGRLGRTVLITLTPAGTARRATPRPAPIPQPGRPDAPPALIGAGSTAWGGAERSLPLAVLPSTDTAARAGQAGRPAAGSAALRRRSCAPEVSPD